MFKHRLRSMRTQEQRQTTGTGPVARFFTPHEAPQEQRMMAMFSAIFNAISTRHLPKLSMLLLALTALLANDVWAKPETDSSVLDASPSPSFFSQPADNSVLDSPLEENTPPLLDQVLDIFQQPDTPTVGPYISYLLDDQDSYDLYTIQKTPARDWNRLNQPVANFGFTTETYWYRLELRNSADHRIERLLEIGYPSLDNISGFLLIQPPHLTPDEIAQGHVAVTRTQQWQLGDRFPVSIRPIKHHNYVMPLILPEHSFATLYLRVKTTGAMQVPVSIWSTERFPVVQQNFLLGQGIYFGILLVMALYNLFIFLSVRDSSYIAYVAYVLVYGMFQACLHGFAALYLWPEYPQINAYAITLLTAANCVMVAAFTTLFLRLRQNHHVFYYSLLLYALIMSGWLILSFALPYNLSIRFSASMTLVGLPLVTFIGIRMWMLGHRSARFFVAAWLCFLTVSFILTLEKLGIVPTTYFTEFGPQIAHAIEAVLLSFALADRINEERRQREAAQQLAFDNEKLARQERQRYLEATLKAAEEEIIASRKLIEVEAANKAKSQFLATMSHEIRTPMNGVLGMVELLRETQLQPQQRQYVEIIDRSGKALLNVINDILDFSKIEAGKMTIESLDLDLDELCLECASVFALIAERKNLELICSIEPGTPTYIKSDPTRLRQILLNLLDNAFKFTQQGHVQLRVREVEGVNLAPHEHLLRFEIRDTGVGIAQEDQLHLFKSFSQAGEGTSRQYGGTGLGLTICQRLSELMGGKIGVESEDGQGSLFWFNIRCREADPAYVRSQVLPFYDLKHHSLLVVDDSTEFAQMMKEQAESWGMRADMAYDGEHALKQARFKAEMGAPYDIITLDLMMPGMGGLECARALRENPRLATSKLLLLTAMRHIPDDEELKAAGIDYAVQKPASAMALKAIFRQLLSGLQEDNGRQLLNEVPDVPQISYAGKRILVAEDNAVNQMIIQGMLRKLGANCRVVNNGREAIQEVFTAKPTYDLVFMDCEMPEIDGYEATRRIRDQERTLGIKPVPILALTAHVLPEHRELSQEAGMNGHLGKPLQFERLKEALYEVFSQEQNQDLRFRHTDSTQAQDRSA